MSTDTPSTQPENVATEDTPRPPDNAVVTSDTAPQEEPTPESQAAGEGGQQAAAASEEEGGTNSSDSASGNEKPAKRRDRASERKIGKLRRQLQSAEDRTAAKDREIERLTRENETLRGSVSEQIEPKLEDFPTPAEYAKAYAKWDAGKKAAKSNPPPSKQPASSETHSQESDAPPVSDKAVADFHRAGKEMLGDEFLEALEERETAVSQFMAEFMFDSDVGPAIYVHLANNVEESRKIYDMPPRKAMAALEELEAKAQKGDLDIDGQMDVKPSGKGSGTNDKGSGKQTSSVGSKAPTPPSSTREQGSVSMDQNPDAENMDDYAARRRKEEARRRGLPV